MIQLIHESSRGDCLSDSRRVVTRIMFVYWTVFETTLDNSLSVPDEVKALTAK